MKKVDKYKKIYAVNFDFSMDKLNVFYPNSNVRQAYDDIKRFLTAHGFEHRQGSGYMSTVTMTAAKFNETIYAMFEKYSWMPKTLKTADVTIVEEEFDLLEKYRKQRKEHTKSIIKKQDIESTMTPEEKAAEADRIMDIVTDVVFSRAAYFENDEIEYEIER